jgi:hypothetical protein
MKTYGAILALIWAFSSYAENRGTGDLGIVIEREAGAVRIVNTTQMKQLAKIDGLGIYRMPLSCFHATSDTLMFLVEMAA